MALTSGDTIKGQSYPSDPDGYLEVVGKGGAAIQVTTGGGAATTATRTNVAGSASSTTILAANTAREGATVYNDSTAILFLELGSAAASATNYTIQIGPQGYYEVPFGYTGQLTGIWAAANGNARVTEISA